MEQLAAGARRLGIQLTPLQNFQFKVYSQELLSWNRRMNLTAITAPEQVETKHFLDSLTVSLALGKESDSQANLGPIRVLDVGSGGGFPGLPLKIVFPELQVSLLEATRKKAAFLKHINETLGLLDVEIIAARAEDAAHDARRRECYDVVVTRALAPMPALAELTLPFCRVGGKVVAQKKGDIASELAQAQESLSALGGRFGRSILVSLPELGEDRVLVVLDKIAATPLRYPRRAGLPQKHPLGLAGWRVS